MKQVRMTYNNNANKPNVFQIVNNQVYTFISKSNLFEIHNIQVYV